MVNGAGIGAMNTVIGIAAVAGVILIIAAAVLRMRKAPSRLLSIEQFRERFVAALSAATPGLGVRTVGRNEVRLILPRGESVLYLDDAYNRYLDAPERLDELLSKVAAAGRRSDA